MQHAGHGGTRGGNLSWKQRGAAAPSPATSAHSPWSPQVTAAPAARTHPHPQACAETPAFAFHLLKHFCWQPGA